MASSYTKEWIKFFRDCGIPPEVATVYALIFYENRIQKNMLLDLNKEYLKDMGITVMGDVIAILRHAKSVHDKYVREQFLSGAEETIEIREDESNSESSPSSKKSTPMKRMLEHYTRKYESPELELPLEKVQIKIQNDKSTVKVPKKLEHRLGLSNSPPVKKKIEAPSKDDSRRLGLEVPVPKVRRVLPENEGGYKIKLPSGSTQRSKKLLEQAKQKQKTVFDRLGESSVSSTTSEVSVVSVGSKKLEANGSVSKEKFSSVFARLGGKTSLVTSTSSVEEIISIPDEPLPYSGVLKPSPTKRKLPNPLHTATMRADDEVSTKPTTVKAKKILPVKRRLGSSLESASTSIDFSSKDLKAIRITTDFQDDDDPLPQKKIKLSARFPSGPQKQSKITEDERDSTVKKFDNFVINPKLKKSAVTSSTSLAQLETKLLKRKVGGETSVNDERTANDSSPAKKVRFGKTTHRLIPGNTPPIVENSKKLKNYPNLTMRIENVNLERKKIDVSGLSIGVKTHSLTSDKIVAKPTVKDRIGNKPPLANRLANKPSSLANRLGKPAKNSVNPLANRLGKPVKISIDSKSKDIKKNPIKIGNGVKRVTSSIHDRLG